MAFLDNYRQQVALLIRVLPFVAEERVFALKGGTAINLFVRCQSASKKDPLSASKRDPLRRAA